MEQFYGRVRGQIFPALVVLLVSACAPVNLAQPTTVVPKPSSGATESSASANPIPAAKNNAVAAPEATQQPERYLQGFSLDGKYYLHLESWRDQGAGIPHAALQIVDISTNTCVDKGCLQTSYSEAEAGVSLEAAEQSLLQQTEGLRHDLKLSSLTTGDRLPVVQQKRMPDGTERVALRLGNEVLQVQLQQKRVAPSLAEGTVEHDQAAMKLEVTYQGQPRSLGSLEQFRDWTMGFSIHEVKTSADGKNVVILVTAKEHAFEGTLGRTLVQGLKL